MTANEAILKWFAKVAFGRDSVSVFLAYVDPGTGALLFQIFVAGLLSVLIFFRNAGRRILGILTWPFSRALRRGGEADVPAGAPAGERSESSTNAP